MKTLEIFNLEQFKKIFEINLNRQPNQSFTTTIERQIYQVEIKTFINDKTFIKISKNGEFLGCGFVKTGLNLIFLNQNENVAFFFLKKTNSNLIKFNWENFGNEIGFFCGVFDDDISIKAEIENHYNLIENTKNLAVF